MDYGFLKSSILSTCFVVCGLAVSVVGCSDKKDGFLSIPGTETGSETTTQQYIIAASTDTNTRSVVAYTTAGAFVAIIKNFLVDIGLPRGLSVLGPSEILVSLDTNDRAHFLQWSPTDGVETDNFFTTLAGNIYDVESDANGNIYVIATNQIRRFDGTAAQVGNPYINTTTGACTLNNPRGLFLTTDNRLIVTNQGGTDPILIYDVSSAGSATCLSSVAVGNNPYGVLQHSNGNLYFVTQGNDQVYRANADGSGATVIFATNTTVINDPTAILELPNGNLAVASSVTDAVWEMDVDGNLIGTQPLINDPLSLNIIDLELLDVEN